ncbi:MAG TPA: Spy/CpxP family protein refolding chaperone [Gemmatimonadaceae bacterium]|nr:Spy/CpxP family protein refolding chaperone [Gemmatimonadaceae bacterium]
MVRKSTLTLAAVALLTSASVSAQGGPPSGGQPGRGMMRASVAILLENKDSIPLTAEQVTKIEEIRKGAETKNAPIVEKARAAREAGSGMDAMREIMAEARKNDEEAYQAALALLTAEQKPKAEAIVTKVREQMRASRRPPTR